jgi:hypothetical protein
VGRFAGMTAWDLAEGAFIAAFLSLWLGFAICMVVLMVHLGSNEFFSTLNNTKKNNAFGQGTSTTGTFLRSSPVGKIVNVILAFGSVALVFSGMLAIFALATQPPTS